MNQALESIDVSRLVADIHHAEAAQRSGAWTEHAKAHRIRRTYAEHVTALYTLRAYLRGRVHRRNPPAQIRDYNRAVWKDAHPYLKPLRWNALEHNRALALETAAAYQPLAA